MDNNDTSDFQDDPYSIEAYLYDSEDDPIPYIIQQLGIYERFILHRYKHQKLAYANCLSKHPDDMANDAQNEAWMYEVTYGMSDQIHILTPYDDYLYLREELLKNPFEISTTPEELLLAYMFCLCKDTRQELWHGEIELCNNNIEYIEQLFIRIQDLLLSLHELWLKNPEGLPPTHHEVAYNYPIGNKVRYTTDPDYDSSIHSILGRKKTSLLSQSRIFQFKELLKKTASKKGGWKSVNAVVEEMTSIFLYHLEKQAQQTAELFKQGRIDFIKLYKHAHNRLQIELEENAWLNNHPLNQERRELADQKMGHLSMLIKEQQSLFDALKQNDNSKVDIDGYQNLLKSNYSVDTLSDWIRDDKVLLKEILLTPKSSKEKSKKSKD